MRLRSIGLAATLSMLLAGCGATVPEASAPSEGIAVHGDWTIAIHSPDGTLDETVTFSNALHPDGAGNIAGVLSGESGAVAYWAIGLASDTGPCSLVCWIDPIQATAESTEDGNVVRISGSTVVESDGQIDRVGTGLGICARVEPDLCREGLEGGIVDTARFRSMTEKELGPDAPLVSSGQTVDVTVDISFTSG